MIEVHGHPRDLLLVLDADGVANLRRALDDVERGAKVILGDPGATLSLRSPDWLPAEKEADRGE